MYLIHWTVRVHYTPDWPVITLVFGFMTLNKLCATVGHSMCFSRLHYLLAIDLQCMMFSEMASLRLLYPLKGTFYRR